MKGGDLVFLGGWLDTGDYVDVYMLASPWTNFFNYVFSTGGAAMPIPTEGLGIALGGYLNNSLYMIAGFADDGGAILQKTLSTGFAYQTVPAGNQLGIGYNWGEPSESTFEPGLRDQTSVELYYRIQLFKELAITPDVQYIKNPALDPTEDSWWVFGLRARLVF
jgi:hypothetical protein